MEKELLGEGRNVGGEPLTGKLLEEWAALLEKSQFQNPFLTPLWHRIWLKHFGRALKTKVFLVRENDGTLLALGAFSHLTKQAKGMA